MEGDLEVMGVSRSGRVRKKSSKLMDFESPDDIDNKQRKVPPPRPLPQVQRNFSQEIESPYIDSKSDNEEGTGGVSSDSDYYDPAFDNHDSMDSMDSEDVVMSDENSLNSSGEQMDRSGNLSRSSNYMDRSHKRKPMPKDGKNHTPYNNSSYGTNSNNQPRSSSRNRSQINSKTSQNNSMNSNASVGSPGNNGGMYRVVGIGPVEIGAHLHLLGESLAIIGERLKEHEGQIAVSGSVSVLLDTLLCSLAPLICLTAHVPAIAPPEGLLQETLDNIAYIMPGL